MDPKDLQEEVLDIITQYCYYIVLVTPEALDFLSREIANAICHKYNVENDLKVDYSIPNENSLPTFGSNEQIYDKGSIFISGTIEGEYHSIKIDIEG